MNKYQSSTKTTYYQKARFFRKTNTNEFAYCIEPFNFFNESSSYESTITPNNLTQAQIDRISKIAHFGYKYRDHESPHWYAITQFMIWSVADPTGDYYFTDRLNGQRVEKFQGEIDEINRLIDNYNTVPSFTNKTFTIIENKEFSTVDTNHILDNFESTSKDLILLNNRIVISNPKKGNYTYKFIKKDNYYNKPIIFYQSPTSQNLVDTGDIDNIEISFNVKVIRTTIEITKLDKDTSSIIPRGEASLDGAIYSLYDENNNLIQELIIKNNQATITNIPFGKYYLKEITPGIGYTLDNNTYEIDINENTYNKELILNNKVIEKKIIIEKKYGDNYLLKGEGNISFQVFNKNKELINTITTSSIGLVEITLPYGEYEFIQINSTKGYHKVDPFTIKIEDNEEEHIELRDLKIEVPNTHTNGNIVILYILHMLLIIW